MGFNAHGSANSPPGVAIAAVGWVISSDQAFREYPAKTSWQGRNPTLPDFE